VCGRATASLCDTPHALPGHHSGRSGATHGATRIAEPNTLNI
jgi:hypothetical protein